MPTKRTPPELFLRYRGVRVYRTYIDGDADRPSFSVFTTDRKERRGYEFNVFDLDEYRGRRQSLMDFKGAIKEAIRNKKLRIPNDQDSKDDRSLEGGADL